MITPFLRGMWLVLVTTVLLSLAPTVWSGETSRTLRNPMASLPTADPSVLRVGDMLYVYGSGRRSPGRAFPIDVTRADDRTSWTRIGSVFTTETMPKWSGPRRAFWAPEVYRVDHRFICYYSTDSKDGRFCIGAATSSSPEGPFTDVGQPLVSNPSFGLIDAGYYHDPLTSKSWLLWKEDRNALRPKEPTNIVIQELAPDGLRLLGSPVELIANDQPWEEDLVEAPSIIYRDGYYYLFFSANAFIDSRYAVGVARSRQITGPYVKWNRNPILKSSDQFDGPGHQFLFEESPGVWTMFYHARSMEGAEWRRLLMSDPVKWTPGGWPYISRGTPSNEYAW